MNVVKYTERVGCILRAYFSGMLIILPQQPIPLFSRLILLLSDRLDSGDNLAVPIKSVPHPFNHQVKNLGTVGALKGVSALHFHQFV